MSFYCNKVFSFIFLGKIKSTSEYLLTSYPTVMFYNNEFRNSEGLVVIKFLTRNSVVFILLQVVFFCKYASLNFKSGVSSFHQTFRLRIFVCIVFNNEIVLCSNGLYDFNIIKKHHKKKQTIYILYV